MAEHTPGPWEKRVTGSYVGVVAPPNKDAPHGQLIAKMVSGNRRLHADAALIAAATETATERDRLRALNAELTEAALNLRRERDELLAMVERLAVTVAGGRAWHVERYERERQETLESARALIAKHRGEAS